MCSNGFNARTACIGCGYCCWKSPCYVAVRLHGPVSKCPSLVWNGKRHICKLMEIPGTLGENYRKELHTGAGCSSNLNSWRREPLQDRTGSKEDEPVVSRTMQIFLACLGRQWISGDVIYFALRDFERRMIDHGMDEERAANMIKLMSHYFKQNRESHVEKFMG